MTKNEYCKVRVDLNLRIFLALPEGTHPSLRGTFSEQWEYTGTCILQAICPSLLHTGNAVSNTFSEICTQTNHNTVVCASTSHYELNGITHGKLIDSFKDVATFMGFI